MLSVLLAVSVVLTYILPKGEFGKTQSGETDYTTCLRLDGASGIPVWKGLLAPILVFFSSDGISLICLSLFIMSISASFNIMAELGGVEAIVSVVAKRFKNRRLHLIVIISFLFYCFGAFLGLFEEMITLLPIVCAICLSIGFDSFTGFLCCILSCGFGFASAITNPFTVILASDIIGVSPMKNIGFRLFIFAVMFLLLQWFILHYIRRIRTNPGLSMTLAYDEKKTETAALQQSEKQDEKKLVKAYAGFIGTSLLLIIISSLIPATRGITVVLLTVYTLIFGILCGVYVCRNMKTVFGAWARGFLGALPAIVYIAIAASIKYVFEEGRILPTIIDQINCLTCGKKPLVNAFSIFLVVLVLEFFISSSTAKAFLVMGILGMVSTGLSKEMLVLLYTFGDGYTNVLFPTSPVLLISLSMIHVEYFKWIKKSLLFFVCTLIIVLALIALGVIFGY